MTNYQILLIIINNFAEGIHENRVETCDIRKKRMQLWFLDYTNVKDTNAYVLTRIIIKVSL